MMAFLRSLLAALRRVSYCPRHDQVHSSDFCPECMEARLRSIGVVDCAAVSPEWDWPLQRNESDHLVIARKSSGEPGPDSSRSLAKSRAHTGAAGWD